MKIVERSHLNARQAVIAAKMVKEKGEFILDDSKEIMLQYYGTIVKDAELSDSCLRTLFIIAVFDRTKFRNEGKLNDLMSILELNQQQFTKDISWMNSKEICDVFQDEAVRIEDQSLRDYILYFFLFESKRYSLQDLFNGLYDSGIGYLIRSVNRASSMGNNQVSYKLLKDVVRKFYRKSFGQSDDNEKIEFLKSFGSFLGSEVIQVSLNIIKRTPVKEHEINFDLNTFDHRVRGKNSDFTILMKNLIIENRKDNSQIIFDLCMRLLQKDNTMIKEIGDFLITEFEIDPNSPDRFEPLKESIPALKDQARKSIAIIDECMFFVIRGLLTINGSKTYSRDSNTISLVNYQLNDDSMDMSVREELFEVLEMVISNGHVPEEILLSIARENIVYTKKSQKIGVMAGNYLLQIMRLSSSNVDKNNIDLVQVIAKHVEYLAGNISLEQVMLSLNTLQTCCWVLNNYSDKSQYRDTNANIQLKSWIEDLNDDLPGSIDAIALCLQPNKLLDSYVIEGQLNNGLEAVGKEQKDKILSSLFNTGLKYVDDYMAYRLVRQYGVGKFLERFEDQYKDNIRFMYLIYSGILTPLDTDVPKLYSLMERLNSQEWIIVKYDAMSEAYQTNTKVVNLVIQRSLKWGLYNGFKYITENTALNIINSVSNKEQLFKWYAKGIAKGVDYDNTLLKLLIDDVVFQKIVINSLFDTSTNVYWKSQISVSPKMDLLWEKSSFRDGLSRKLDSLNVNYRDFNSGWEAVFLKIFDLNKRWLLDSLENTTSLVVAQKIMLLVNRFFTYDDSIDFFIAISESVFPLESFEIRKMSNSWAGSEFPVIKKDLAFILKLRPIFKDAASIIYLKKLQENFEDRIQQTLLGEYLKEI